MESMKNEIVAWKMLDGNVMCGRVTQKVFGRLYVTRFDGGTCTIDAEKTWRAGYSDINAAIRFFATIGKSA